jgi:hypothetical protein
LSRKVPVSVGAMTDEVKLTTAAEETVAVMIRAAAAVMMDRFPMRVCNVGVGPVSLDSRAAAGVNVI